MWRYWRSLPPKGRVGIFAGSWYSDPIRERILDEVSLKELDARADQINRFEAMLVNEGALVLKFWFHLSKEQQKKRTGRAGSSAKASVPSGRFIAASSILQKSSQLRPGGFSQNTRPQRCSASTHSSAVTLLGVQMNTASHVSHGIGAPAGNSDPSTPGVEGLTAGSTIVTLRTAG